MVDEASVGGIGGAAREGVDPLIIFDSGKTLNKISTNEISSNTQKKATKNYSKWWRKANSNSRNGEW